MGLVEKRGAQPGPATGDRDGPHEPRGGAAADRHGAVLGGEATFLRRIDLRAGDAACPAPISSCCPARRTGRRSGIHRPGGPAGAADRTCRAPPSCCTRRASARSASARRCSTATSTVGEVLGWDIADMADSVTIHAFVRAPFDRYVHDGSRFWNASGATLQLGPKGVQLQLESLRALVLGGVAFDTPADGARHAGQRREPRLRAVRRPRCRGACQLHRTHPVRCVFRRLRRRPVAGRAGDAARPADRRGEQRGPVVRQGWRTASWWRCGSTWNRSAISQLQYARRRRSGGHAARSGASRPACQPWHQQSADRPEGGRAGHAARCAAGRTGHGRRACWCCRRSTPAGWTTWRNRPARSWPSSTASRSRRSART